jgi:hypothetical protein
MTTIVQNAKAKVSNNVKESARKAAFQTKEFIKRTLRFSFIAIFVITPATLYWGVLGMDYFSATQSDKLREMISFQNGADPLVLITQSLEDILPSAAINSPAIVKKPVARPTSESNIEPSNEIDLLTVTEPEPEVAPVEIAKIDLAATEIPDNTAIEVLPNLELPISSKVSNVTKADVMDFLNTQIERNGVEPRMMSISTLGLQVWLAISLAGFLLLMLFGRFVGFFKVPYPGTTQSRDHSFYSENTSLGSQKAKS